MGIKYNNQLIVESVHNYLEYDGGYYYHHKRSISSKNKYAIIARTRGSYSYIVKCIAKEETLFSISHGAGRKWPRNLCNGRLENKYKKEQLKTIKLGSEVIADSPLLYEDAMEAYKDVESVIEVLLEYKVIELVARLKPLVTYKC